jgi:hypothetical protein
MKKIAECIHAEILDAAYAARDIATTAEAAARATLVRAQRHADAEKAKAMAIRDAMASREAEESESLASLLAAGGPTAELPPPEDSSAVALVTAERAASVAAKALARVERSHVQALAKLQAAKDEVERIVDAQLVDEREELAAEVEAAHIKLVAKVDDLRQCTPDWINTPIDTVISVSPAVQLALSRAPPADDLHVPLNVLRDGRPVDRTTWASRRSALIRGPAPSDDSPRPA